MKGFGIEIKNRLLEPKHVVAMDSAVWLYMWLLDHVTSVDENDIGKVLGGKQILDEEIATELGVSKHSVVRWRKKLTAYPYIKATRTPRGISYRIFKTHKRFGNREVPKSQFISEGSAKIAVAGEVPKSQFQYKTEQPRQNNNKDTSEQSSQDHKLTAEVIKAMESVDIKNQTYYGNKTQRSAAEFLVKHYGFDEVKKRISYLPQTNKIPYFPTITTPVQLRDKWVQLEDSVAKERAKRAGREREFVI